ncbi:hypothetical protein WJX72_002307 [[Myrmecia] bisecta]|uniref:Uncharacterized protein n=1 Tax=[Myrmecia] bisecta TaxID=41462 RepID=A0AAW1Q167_9CHLO
MEVPRGPCIRCRLAFGFWPEQSTEAVGANRPPDFLGQPGGWRSERKMGRHCLWANPRRPVPGNLLSIY